MKSLIALALIASIGLASCATTVIPPPAIVVAGETWDGILVLIDNASLAATAAIQAGATTKAQDTVIAGIEVKVKVAIDDGNKAFATGQTGTVASEITVLEQLLADLNNAYPTPASMAGVAAIHH